MPAFCDLVDPSEQSRWSVYKLTDCKHSHTHTHTCGRTHFTQEHLNSFKHKAFVFATTGKIVISIAVVFLLIPSGSITVFVADIQVFYFFGLYMRVIVPSSELHLSLLKMEFAYLAAVSPPPASVLKKTPHGSD